MNGSKDPEAATNFCHFCANTAMMTAATFSMVKPEGARPAFSSENNCDSDMTGGSFRTFNPHPTEASVMTTPL